MHARNTIRNMLHLVLCPLSVSLVYSAAKDKELTKGQPAQITLSKPLPEEVEILPPPEALQCCSVARG